MLYEVITPESFAEETQNFVHDMRNIPKVNGWDNQLRNEPELVIAYERKWLFLLGAFHGLECDVVTHLGGARITSYNVCYTKLLRPRWTARWQWRCRRRSGA